MDGLKYVTREMENPKGKVKVYVSCHTDDYEKHFPSLSEDFLMNWDCSLWFSEKDTERTEEYLNNINDMQLFVIFVTDRMLRFADASQEKDISFALKQMIPILPILEDDDLIEPFTKKFGDMQFLCKNSQDKSADSYKEKLIKYIEKNFFDKEMRQKVASEFKTHLFLSYRKKDRDIARKLMHRIHSINELYDVAVWYDEFLVPGQDYNEEIDESVEKSNAFLLMVTPSIVEKTFSKDNTVSDNYVVRVEYPLAKKLNKIIIPIEMVQTNREALEKNFADLPELISIDDEQKLKNMLQSIIPDTAHTSENDMYHKFLIGLAYLEGIEVEIDRQKAVTLIESAALSGVSEAAKRMVRICASGIGVKRDLEKALYWQNKLVELLKKEYENLPTKKAGLDVLDEMRELIGILEDTKSDELPKATIDYLMFANELAKKWNTDEVNSHLAGGFLRFGDLKRNLEDYREALSYYKKAQELLESELKNKNIDYESCNLPEIDSNSVTMVMLQDYCCALCNLADLMLFNAEELGYSQPKVSTAEYFYNRVYKLLESPTMKNNYHAYNEQLSVCYSRMGAIAKCKGNLEVAKEWYEKGLIVDIDRVNELAFTKDIDAYDGIARSLYALAFVNEDDPDLRCLLEALYIWEKLEELVPEFVEYKERANDLRTIVAQVEEFRARTSNPTLVKGAAYKELKNQMLMMPYFMPPTRKMVLQLLQKLKRLVIKTAEKKRVEEELAKAKQGDPVAMLELAWRFMQGRGVPENNEEAQAWATKAAKLKYKNAETFLRDFFPSEEEKKQREHFLDCLERANKGDGYSAISVAWCYYRGEGADVDEQSAIKYAKKAINECNHARGYSWLSDYYYKCRDYAQALHYAKLGAKNKDHDSCYNLATMYRRGNGVKKSKMKAKYWKIKYNIYRRRSDRAWKRSLKRKF